MADGSIASAVRASASTTTGIGASAISRNSPGFGAHLAQVAVDPQTGEVEVVRYVVVQDVGRAINPAEVEGQIVGGVTQGLGWALYEQIIFGDDGQVLTGSLLDYAIPRASWFPPIELDETVTPTDVNPLGVKGVGEAGTIASTAATANAVNDALAPLGIRHLDMPHTPQNVWRAIQGAKGGRA